MLEGGNTSVYNTDSDKPSPGLILSDTHEMSDIYGRNIPGINKDLNTPGSDSAYNTTLQDGPEIVVDPTPGDWTQATHHGGLIVMSLSGVSKEIQDYNFYSHQKTDYNSQPAIHNKNTDYVYPFKEEVSKDIDTILKPVQVENTGYINETKDT